jgi:hypothetical protein
MKLNYYYTLITLLVILTSGCQNYYQGGFNGNEFSQMPTPIYKDNTTQRNHYINAGIAKGIEYYKTERNDVRYISYNYGVGAERITFAIGVKPYIGNYFVNTFEGELSNLNKKYNYWGVQTQCMFGINIPVSDKFHWRILNWQMSWDFERGDFYDFRKNMIKLDEELELGLRFVDDFTNIAGHGYSELIFIPSENISIGVLGGIGTSVKQMNISSFVGGSIEYQRFGIKATRMFFTPNLATIVIPIFNDKINTENDLWQLAVYYKF